MYAEHVPVISAACRESPEIFARAILFASLSIRQPVENVPAMLDDVDRNRSQSPYLWGFKRATYEAVTLKAASLWRVLDLPVEEALYTLVREVPGLGIVKAAFALQLAGFDVACLDSRNIKREGRNPRAFRTDGKPPSRKKIAEYLGETGGRAQAYWDAWCADVADARGSEPEIISALHLAVVPDDYLPF